MPLTLAEYFQTSALFMSAIQSYESNYVNNPRRDWGITGRFGKFTAYSWSEQVFDNELDRNVGCQAVSEILEIVQSWNGDIGNWVEIKKYGEPLAIWNVLVNNEKMFRCGGLTLLNLEAEHYQQLVNYLACFRSSSPIVAMLGYPFPSSCTLPTPACFQFMMTETYGIN